MPRTKVLSELKRNLFLILLLLAIFVILFVIHFVNYYYDFPFVATDCQIFAIYAEQEQSLEKEFPGSTELFLDILSKPGVYTAVGVKMNSMTNNQFTPRQNAFGSDPGGTLVPGCASNSQYYFFTKEQIQFTTLLSFDKVFGR